MTPLEPPLPTVFLQFHLEERSGMDVQTRRDMPRTVEVKILAQILEIGTTTDGKLLLSANRKSYMPCRLAPQRMILTLNGRIARYLCCS